VALAAVPASLGAVMMADPIPFEQQAEALKIRSNPKPVTRINRKIIIAGAGAGLLLLFFGASVALNPPRAIDDTENTELRALPASYADVPVLGEPVPGDLGASIVQTEREFGIEHEVLDQPVMDFRPDPNMDRLRAERIRQAQLEQDSIEAPVFFQLSQQSRGTANTEPGTQTGFRSTNLDPFASNSTLPQSAFSGSGGGIRTDSIRLPYL